MTAPPAPDKPFGMRHVVGMAHPAHALVACVLVCTAVAAIGVAPGLVTALWLSLVTPGLVVIDIRTRRLPNLLVVPGLLAVLIDGGWSAISSAVFPVPSFVATAIVAAAMLVLNLVGGLGMGDVKLGVVIAGCLSLVSPLLGIVVVMLGFVVGGAYSAVLLLRHRGQHDRRIAFGPVLLLAFWAVVAVLAADATSVGSLS